MIKYIMERTIKTIQRERPKKDKSTINENHINIDINMADKEKEYIKEVVQEILPVLVQPIDDIDEEDHEDEEMDKLVQELEETIKEFMTFRQGLIERKIDVPNNLLELPEVDIKEKSDIESLIKILKDRIIEFKFLLNKAQTPPPQAQPIKSQPTLSTIPQRLRSRMDVAQPARTRIRPAQFGDANFEEARREFRETQTFLLNRDVNNTTDMTLIERALLRLNRNKNFINSILNEPESSARERNLLRDLLQQVEANINRVSNRKLTLQGVPIPPPEPPLAEGDAPAPAPAPAAADAPEVAEIFEEEDVVRPEEQTIPLAPKRNASKYRNNLPLYITDLQNYITQYRPELPPSRIDLLMRRLEATKKEVEDAEAAAEMIDDTIPLDEMQDEGQRAIERRLLMIQGYLGTLTSTGRSQLSVAKLRNDLETFIQELIEVRNIPDTPIENIREFLRNRMIIELSNGSWAAAIAFQNMRTDLSPSDAQLDMNTRLELRELDMTNIRATRPNARQAYGLYKTSGGETKRLIRTNESSPLKNEVLSRLTEDGDIYRKEDLTPTGAITDYIDVNQQLTPETGFTEAPPEAEAEATPPVVGVPITERDIELAEYRNSLYYTGREGQQTIVDNLNTQIGDSMNKDNIIILDRTNGNIPATFAYYRLPPNRPREQDIDNIELRQVPSSDIPSGGNDAFLLYINGELQRDEFGQQKLFNQYGDPYSAEDIRGDSVAISFPFRPTSRTDLGAGNTRTTLREIIENRKEAIKIWALPPENENDRQTLLNVIDMVLDNVEDDNDIYIPILSNAGYDVGATFAYINEHNNGRVPALEDSETKLELVESTRHPGLYFLKVDNQVYDMEGDMIFFPTGVGERIKMKGMKIHGTDSVIPSGFRGGDSYTIGRISDIGPGGLDAGRNPILYSIERVASFAPEFLDIYDNLKEGN